MKDSKMRDDSLSSLVEQMQQDMLSTLEK